MVKNCETCNKPFTVNGEPDYCSRVCKDREILEIWTDGGCKDKNPSPIGISYAYLLLGTNGIVLKEESGFRTDMHTNNQAELLAIILALRNVPDNWSGSICSDSQVSLKRFTGEYRKMNGIPEWMIDEVLVHRNRLGDFKTRLISGHPSKSELSSGISKKGREISLYNVRVDFLCQEECRNYRPTDSSLREEIMV